MKKLWVALLLLVVTTAGYSQCDKKTFLSAAATDHLGADSSVQRTEDGAITIEFDKTTFNVNPPNGSTLTGKVNAFTCNWSTPYKEGKMQLKVALTNEQGETQNFSVTIQGKAGKIILYAVMDDHPDQMIRLIADKFEEKR